LISTKSRPILIHSKSTITPIRKFAPQKDKKIFFLLITFDKNFLAMKKIELSSISDNDDDDAVQSEVLIVFACLDGSAGDKESDEESYVNDFEMGRVGDPKENHTTRDKLKTHETVPHSVC
jgi:hypothetical protein